MYTGESEFPRPVPLDLEFCVPQVAVSTCFAVFKGQCHTCVTQQTPALTDLPWNPVQTHLGEEVVLGQIRLDRDLYLPAFISSPVFLMRLLCLRSIWINCVLMFSRGRRMNQTDWLKFSFHFPLMRMFISCECMYQFSSVKLISHFFDQNMSPFGKY